MKDNGQLEFTFPREDGDGLAAFPHDPHCKGYNRFESEREVAIEKLRNTFGVMIGQQVRLRLAGWDEEFVGKLLLNTLLLPKSKKDDIPLCIGSVTFDFRDIEMCSVLKAGMGRP